MVSSPSDCPCASSQGVLQRPVCSQGQFQEGAPPSETRHDCVTLHGRSECTESPRVGTLVFLTWAEKTLAEPLPSRLCSPTAAPASRGQRRGSWLQPRSPARSHGCRRATPQPVFPGRSWKTCACPGRNPLGRPKTKQKYRERREAERQPKRFPCGYLQQRLGNGNSDMKLKKAQLSLS